MRLRTAVGLAVVCLLLGGLVAYGLAAPGGGEFVELWVSDTPRDNTVNHHAVGAQGRVVVAPVAEVPREDVQMTDTSCALVRLAPGTGSVEWRAGVPPAECFTHALTEPAIGDVDGDEGVEVVAATTEDALVARDARTGNEEWRVALSTYGYGRPTIGNVTPAPGPEVVAADIDGGVVVARGDGTVAWRYGPNETGWRSPAVWARPVVDDLDADGRPEVLLSGTGGTVSLGTDGAVAWAGNASAAYVATADADGDPAVEVFAAGTSGLRAYDGASGTVEWTRDLANGRVRAAADADGDGTVELFVGRVGGEVLALDAGTGATEWTTSVERGDDTIVPPPVLADVDGDDGVEVIAATSVGTVVALDPGSGAELAAYERPVPIWTVATPADLDDDGDREVLVRYGDGRVVALDYVA